MEKERKEEEKKKKEEGRRKKRRKRKSRFGNFLCDVWNFSMELFGIHV